MTVTPDKQRPRNPLRLPILTQRLGDRENVGFVESGSKR